MKYAENRIDKWATVSDMTGHFHEWVNHISSATCILPLPGSGVSVEHSKSNVVCGISAPQDLVQPGTIVGVACILWRYGGNGTARHVPTTDTITHSITSADGSRLCFTCLTVCLSGLRHVRGDRPNRAADFRWAAILDPKRTRNAATRCVLRAYNAAKCDCGRGLCPDPAGGTYSAPQTP